MLNVKCMYSALTIGQVVLLSGHNREVVVAHLLFCKFQKPDDEEMDILSHEEDFCLPQSYFVKEES